MIASQQYFPIRLDGRGYDKVLVDYESDAALMCPPHKRAVFQQSAFLKKTIQCLQTLTGLEFFPRFENSKCSSLQHIGYNGQPPAGLPCRPRLPNAEATLQCVKDFLSKQGSQKQSMNQPIHIPKQDATISFPDILEEADQKDRYRRYQLLYRATNS